MRSSGLSFEKAYYAIRGPELLKTGEQIGSKRTQQKIAKDVHVHSKGNSGATDKVEKCGSMLDAYRAVCREKGVEPQA